MASVTFISIFYSGMCAFNGTVGESGIKTAETEVVLGVIETFITSGNSITRSQHYLFVDEREYCGCKIDQFKIIIQIVMVM